MYVDFTYYVYNTNVQSLKELLKRVTNTRLYKGFSSYISYKKLQHHYVIQPYAVGRDKRSLAMILPSKVVKGLKINTQSIFLLLQVNDKDLRMKIIDADELTNNAISVDQSLVTFPTDITN